MTILKICFRGLFVYLFLFGLLKINKNIAADQPVLQESTCEEPLPVVKIENGRYIMENLPPEMSGEENGQWIKDLLKIFALDPSEAEIQYGKSSISFKYPCNCCRSEFKE